MAGVEVPEAAVGTMATSVAAGARLKLSAGGLCRGEGFLDASGEHVEKVADTLGNNANGSVNSVLRGADTFGTNGSRK